jgi:PrtD family type I secretion system ABC transporter
MAALAQAEAAVRNAETIAAMGMLARATARWQAQNAVSLSHWERAGMRSGNIRAIARFLRQFLQVAMMGLGAWLVLGSEITAGTMIAGSILLTRALAPIDLAIGSWRSAVAAREAFERLSGLLRDVPAKPSATALPAPRGRLDVHDAAFLRPDTQEPVFRSVSFKLEPGEVLGLIGPTAAGKTTLARMLVGNVSPRVGHVRLGGADVAAWDSEDLGPHIGYLPQDVELLDGTVRDNIARLSDASAEAVVAAAQLAEVHDEILRLPNAYETGVGNRGNALSGGQRQRIALARAVFGKPRLVVLDEPNSNLDQAGEEALVTVLRRLKARGVTTVIVAHRQTVLKAVDKIGIMRNGTMEIFGERDAVLARIMSPAVVKLASQQRRDG